MIETSGVTLVFMGSPWAFRAVAATAGEKGLRGAELKV
jgi:hypothetical protein